MKNKKLISTLSAVAIAASITPVSAFADVVPTVENTTSGIESTVDGEQTGSVVTTPDGSGDGTSTTEEGVADEKALKTAVANAQDNVQTTIKLSTEIDMGSLTGIAGLTIPENKNIVLDLNGQTLKGNLITNDSNYAKAHIILNNGNLTITDTSREKTGEIINENLNSHGCTRTIKNNTNATLTILNGTIKGTVGLLNLGNCTIGEKDGDRNVKIISEAVFGSGGWDNSAAAIEQRAEYGTLTIYNAEVRSLSRAAIFCDDAGKFYVYDGKFTGNSVYGVLNGSKAYASGTIYGGSWSSDPEDALSRNVYSEISDEGYYEVKEVTIKKVSVNTESELINVLNNATSSNAVDITINGNIVLKNDIELKRTSKITVANGKNFTVGENIVMVNNGIFINNGTLTVNGYMSNPLNIENNGTITNIKSATGDYSINTPMDLQWITYLVENENIENWNITLENDIVMPTFNGEKVKFQSIEALTNGTFNGNGHKIENLYCKGYSEHTGMVNDIENFEFKNLKLENCDISSATGYTGGLVGCTYGNATFRNIDVSGSVKVTWSSYACAAITGGINSSGENNEIYFIDCNNSASIGGTNGYNIGSMYGTSSGSKVNIYIYNCSNLGDITAKGSMGYVFGWGHLNSASTLEIVGFNNTGTVNGGAGSICDSPGSGYTYKKDQASNEYVAYKNSTGWVISKKADVKLLAETSGIPYQTLQEAISAAVSGDLVKLLDSIEIGNK